MERSEAILRITKINVRKDFTTGEEIANAVTHGLGLLLGIAALVIVAVKGARSHNPLYIITMRPLITPRIISIR